MQKALYDKYAPILLGIIYRYFPEKERSNDILQEVFIIIFKNIKSFRNEGSFEGWLKRITVNTTINFLRKENRRPKHVELFEHHKTTSNQHNDSHLILGEIAALPTNQRLIFNLFGIEGYSSTEVAEIMDMSAENVRVIYHRARKFLQERLKATEFGQYE